LSLPDDLRNADLRRAALAGRRFDRVSLAGADLRGADLRGTNLSLLGGVLKGAAYDDSTQWPEGFFPEMRGAVRVEEA